ncbi:uncharacterized protein CANTADRAFT_91270 [Suhomyces tanzawaensis NRRL Y-17324]|uniref:Uncharacterized protein n=1 Tax=Suhomyces tanzawaensis NRRL Y-17324 TaxID=984487 RepID=A0A1E4SE99_9ASCO|nr:uncharacterized protein CANTADRAFT_91270 [Suhomyces tanzawaensis NRRL Y-17324]ODV77813.1 hypothetical protein CANTADRAFT_91270 [Suhomyces tanzawaensis NRRL Y-17324]
MYLLDILIWTDNHLTTILSSTAYTSNLITTPISKFITEVLILAVVSVISYEVIYWSGIYLNLWEYHAKDIFTEVPIHCAHIYTRVNVVKKDDLVQLREYYALKHSSKFNLSAWNKLDNIGREIFKLKQFIKYHLEFSPEDFEMNDDPEYGSNVEHLRNRIAELVNNSDVLKKYLPSKVDHRSVFIFNNCNDEVSTKENAQYLVKCHIETGNVIDCIIVT